MSVPTESPGTGAAEPTREVDLQDANATIRGGLLVPCLVVFVAGFCTMVIELVAGRLLAGYIGSSQYTWASVIGIILAGISLGSYLGGRLADRYESKRLVCSLFLGAAVFCLLIIPISQLVGSATSQWFEGMWTARVLTVVFVTFIIPSTLLGMICPAVVKWALDHDLATGGTVGTIYAWTNISSILGTFVTGFYLVSHFRVSQIVIMASLGLALAGLAFLPAIWSDRRGKTAPLAPSFRPIVETEGRAGLFVPSLLVFLSGFCVMMVEMIISRLVAVHIGQSLFTWTSVIGVVLAGISLGNYVGGQLADRISAKPLVSILFMVAAIATFSILPLSQIVSSADDSWMSKPQWMGVDLQWALRVAGVVFVAFFPAAMALGTISPAVAKWALENQRATGRTVGVIYAWNTVGSILGTFTTSFWLISMLYVSRLTAAATAVLTIVSFAFAISTRRGPLILLTGLWVIEAAVVCLLAIMPAERFERLLLAAWPVRPEEVSVDGNLRGNALARFEADRIRKVARLFGRAAEINPWDQHEQNFRDVLEYYDESNYYSIKVGEDTLNSHYQNDFELDEEGKAKEGQIRQVKVRDLVLDALIHGYVDLANLKYIHYEYEHIYASVSHRILNAHQAKGEKLRVLFLGGGSYTFPRYLTEFYPNIDCDVAEIDPKVTETVRKAMGMNQACNKKFFLLADQPPIKTQKEIDAEKAAGEEAPPGVFRAMVDALIGPSMLTSKKLFEHKLELAHAKLVKTLSPEVNYVLDIRTDRSAPSPVLDQAKAMKIPVLDPAAFEQLAVATSHSNVHTAHMDARQFIMQSKSQGQYDVIYGDAFNDFSVPSHLTTLEFNTEMAKLLKPDGVFMANIIDIWSSSRFMGPYINTLKRVFKHVYLFDEGGDPTDDRATFVLICSNEPMELDNLGEAEGDIKSLKGRMLTGRLLAPVTRGGLVPLPVQRFSCDGKQSKFSLPAKARDAVATIERVIPADEYSLEGSDRIEFDEPLKEGEGFKITLKPPTTVETETADGSARSFTLPGYSRTADSSERVGTQQYDRQGVQTVVFKSAPVKRTKVAAEVKISQSIKSFKGDGKQTLFELPKYEMVRLTTSRVLGPDEYSLLNGTTIELNEAPPAGSVVVVRPYSEEEIVLTDEFCPVDNLLAEVAATRIDDDARTIRLKIQADK